MGNLNDCTEYKISVYLWQSVPPILLVLGTAGNLLTILVLLQRKNRQSTTALYLVALAVSDTLVLWTGLLRQWIKHMFNVDVRNLSLTGCKLHVFLVNALFQCSSWILVAVTLERFTGVLFPHTVKTFCRRRNAGIAIWLITTCLLLLNSHWLYGVNLESYIINNSTTVMLCDTIDDESYIKFYGIWKWVDLCIYSLIPLILFSVSNISIIYRVFSRKHRARIEVAPNNLTSKKTKLSQLTVMLVTTNTVFILLSAPISIYIIWCKPDISNHFLWWAIVNLLAYLNNTLNFVLYFLSGSKFRQQVKDFLFCK